MIRFCDREVVCIEYGSTNRAELLSWFSSEHSEDVIIVYDNLDTKRYVGEITYYSLLCSDNIYDAIRDEYVILDENMWKKARMYFHKMTNVSNRLLPILDKKHQLLCYAYEDADANREIRMLRELSEGSGLLHFRDVYPCCKCVKIDGFNELAYFFAKYLKSQGIPVQVIGAMWRDFLHGDDWQGLDYECMTIYAEGVGEKSCHWKDNLLRSVSVEFECVDLIYERNIKSQLIKNADVNYEILFDRLVNEKEIVIIGSGIEAQNTYDFLIKNGINICCFMDDKTQRLFGKKVLDRVEVENEYEKALFIQCSLEGSAWGMGDVDYYDYIGYERNKRFFLIGDYVGISQNNLINILRKRKVVLVGDVFLCKRLYDYFEENKIASAKYLEESCQNNINVHLPKIHTGEFDEETTCLIVIPETYRDVKCYDQQWKERKKNVMLWCEQNGIVDYTDFFSYMDSYINIESSISVKYRQKQLMPKRIVLGAINDHSGNIFFRGLLDSHPSIVMLSHGFLSHNLFWICIKLSIEKVGDILSLFWNIYGTEVADMICNVEAFNKKMEELLKGLDKITSQELFVAFHIAYMYMYGINVIESDIKNVIIYWEPHYVSRSTVEHFSQWLGDEKVPYGIFNLVRNMCMRKGSGIKDVIARGIPEEMHNLCIYVSDCCVGNRHSCGNRLVMKFEDLKCNPREKLEEFCHNWGISWNESLMATTSHGKRVSYNNGDREVADFDLGPVYDTYEKYLSGFDRLRIMIINCTWQKGYGYPYVDLLSFSKRELQEMFIKGFRFDVLIGRSEKEIDFEIEIQRLIRKNLQMLRMIRLSCE